MNNKEMLWIYIIVLLFSILIIHISNTQAMYPLLFNPAQEMVYETEKLYRDELCLDSEWQFMPVYETDLAKFIKPEQFCGEAVPSKILLLWDVSSFAQGDRSDFVTYPFHPRVCKEVQREWMREDFILPMIIGYCGDKNSMKKRWSSQGKPCGAGETGMAYHRTPKQIFMTSSISNNIRAAVQNLVDGGYANSIIVGILKEGRIEYYGYGPLVKGKTDENTIFEIGSLTKIFTTLLLADMVKNGELALDDPVECFLPVRIPSKNGKKITLWHLATHTSGLPRMPDNFVPSNWNNPYKDYTIENLYDFLSTYELTRAPGAQYEYSNLGIGLLGHILSLRSNLSYEDLVKERICNELDLEDTAITLTQEQKTRLAKTRIDDIEISNWDFDVLAGCGALRSTAKDMLKFLLAEMGIMKSRLSLAMEFTQEPQFLVEETQDMIGIGWFIPSKNPKIRYHSGATAGYSSFVGFDREKKTAVVVLLSGESVRSKIYESVFDIGFHLLNPEFELYNIPIPQKQNH